MWRKKDRTRPSLKLKLSWVLDFMHRVTIIGLNQLCSQYWKGLEPQILLVWVENLVRCMDPNIVSKVIIIYII